MPRAAHTPSTRHRLQLHAKRAEIVFPKWEPDLVPFFLVGPCCTQLLERSYKPYAYRVEVCSGSLAERMRACTVHALDARVNRDRVNEHATCTR